MGERIYGLHVTDCAICGGTMRLIDTRPFLRGMVLKEWYCSACDYHKTVPEKKTPPPG
jgi:C4-type Zn-finger protein